MRTEDFLAALLRVRPELIPYRREIGAVSWKMVGEPLPIAMAVLACCVADLLQRIRSNEPDPSTWWAE